MTFTDPARSATRIAADDWSFPVRCRRISLLVEEVFGSSGAVKCASCAASAGLGCAVSSNSDETRAELTSDGCIMFTSLHRVAVSRASAGWGNAAAVLGARVSVLSEAAAGGCVSRFELLDAWLWGCWIWGAGDGAEFC